MNFLCLSIKKSIMESTHNENQEEDEVAMFDLSLKKKKKKKSETTEKKEEQNPPEEVEEDYTYINLLERLMNKLREDRPSLTNKKKKVVIPLAEVVRAGKRSIWANFSITCSILRRPPEHVSAFIASELSAEISINGQTQLVIKGKFNNKQIESVVKKYILEYVSCSSCHQLETTMTKDPITRIIFVTCENCQASTSRSNISTHRTTHSTTSNTSSIKTIS